MSEISFCGGALILPNPVPDCNNFIIHYSPFYIQYLSGINLFILLWELHPGEHLVFPSQDLLHKHWQGFDNPA